MVLLCYLSDCVDSWEHINNQRKKDLEERVKKAEAERHKREEMAMLEAKEEKKLGLQEDGHEEKLNDDNPSNYHEDVMNLNDNSLVPSDHESISSTELRARKKAEKKEAKKAAKKEAKRQLKKEQKRLAKKAQKEAAKNSLVDGAPDEPSSIPNELVMDEIALESDVEKSLDKVVEQPMESDASKTPDSHHVEGAPTPVSNTNESDSVQPDLALSDNESDMERTLIKTKAASRKVLSSSDEETERPRHKKAKMVISSSDSNDESISKKSTKKVKHSKKQKSKSSESSDSDLEVDNSPVKSKPKRSKKSEKKQAPEKHVENLKQPPVVILSNICRQIKSNLIRGHEDYPKATSGFKSFLDVEVRLPDLTKVPDVMDIIKKCRRYKLSEEVRSAAITALGHFQKIQATATKEELLAARQIIDERNKKNLPKTSPANENGDSKDSPQKEITESFPVKPPQVTDSVDGVHPTIDDEASKSPVIDEEAIKKSISEDLESKVNAMLTKIKKTDELFTKVDTPKVLPNPVSVPLQRNYRLPNVDLDSRIELLSAKNIPPPPPLPTNNSNSAISLKSPKQVASDIPPDLLAKKKEIAAKLAARRETMKNPSKIEKSGESEDLYNLLGV